MRIKPGRTGLPREDLVIDNANPTKEARARYIQVVKETGASVVGYTRAWSARTTAP